MASGYKLVVSGYKLVVSGYKLDLSTDRHAVNAQKQR